MAKSLIEPRRLAIRARCRDDAEVLDPRPLAVPLSKPTPIKDMIQTMIRRELSQVAQAQGAESFEDADDFEEDPDAETWASPYEVRDMEPESVPSGTLDDPGTLDGPAEDPPDIDADQAARLIDALRAALDRDRPAKDDDSAGDPPDKPAG